MKKFANCGFILTFLLLCNCIGTGASKKTPGNHFDKLLMFSLDYVLKKNKLAIAYYKQPLRIVQSKMFPINGRIVVNSRECILLPESTKPMDIIRKMDIFKPVPLVEISDFKSINNAIMLRLIFRATGNSFDLHITQVEDGKFVVSKMERFEI